MQFKRNSFLKGYVILVLFDLACGYEPLSNFRVVSKPLLLLSLLVYFITKAKSHRSTTFYLTLGALFCSLLGDVFLLFENRSSTFFTLGLASFLVAHVLFSLTFIQKWNSKAPLRFGWIILLLFSYGGILFYILKGHLGALQIPVILYILGIMSMVITAYRRKGSVSSLSFNLAFIGALCFVLSDSVLALNKFMFSIPLSHIIVMGTYASAQYLITQGVLKQGDFGN